MKGEMDVCLEGMLKSVRGSYRPILLTVLINF